MKILSHASVKKKTKKFKGFQISHFYWSFLSDTTAVKGLRQPCEISIDLHVPSSVATELTMSLVVRVQALLFRLKLYGSLVVKLVYTSTCGKQQVTGGKKQHATKHVM